MSSPPLKQAKSNEASLKPRPQTIDDCYLDRICTFAVTGRTYPKQRWVQLPESPSNEGMCLVCAREQFSHRRDEWTMRGGGNDRSQGFFCDWGAQGDSTCLPKVFAGEEAKDGEFILDSSLSLDHNKFRYNKECKDVLKHLTGDDILLDNNLEVQESNNGKGYYFHHNYMRYLELCWASHAGLVIVPDHFWFVVACQLAKHIHQYASDYQALFTTEAVGAEKTQLTFVVPDPSELPLNLVVDELRKRVPGIDVELFLPEFSTSTDETKLAIASCFCEAMEAYYSYCTSRCGISKVHVRGNRQDWLKMAEHCQKLKAFLTAGQAPQYLETLSQRFREIADGASATWKEFFEIVNCGSGRDKIINGWVCELYSLTTDIHDYQPGWDSSKKTGFKGADIEKFHDGSKVNYRDIDSDTAYRKCFGLMGCRLDGRGYLTPHFHQARFKQASPKEREDKLLKNFSQGERATLHTLQQLDRATKEAILDMPNFGNGSTEAKLREWFLTQPTPVDNADTTKAAPLMQDGSDSSSESEIAGV